MGERTQIEWTDATWNPATGCTEVSAGCDHCYAARLAHGRLRERYLANAPTVDTLQNRSNPFAVRLWPERLRQPERWAEAKMIFVNSMSDLFHKDIPDSFVRQVFEVMLRVDHHIYQVLTKRPARALQFWGRHKDLFGGGNIPDHIWMGTSIENQEVEYRVRHLRKLPAATRFLSCEPLLGPIQLDLAGIRWVIVGGESGIGFRRADPDWVRDIREQCRRAGVPFFFKQWGGRTFNAGGRLLDGRTWDEYPLNGRCRISKTS
jgi:protein gp37